MDRIISKYPLPFGCVIYTYEARTPAFSVQAITDGADSFADDLQSAIDEAPPTMVMTSGYNASGHYIGSEETTKYLVEERGISPETMDGNDGVCCIGFCEKDQKWYGWSHRAIFGFGIGSVIKRGDCGYLAPNAEAYGQQMLDFFVDEDGWHKDRKHRPSVNADGGRGVLLEAVYTENVPNEKLRGTKYELFRPYPQRFGRGEWVVESMDDARIAACDFAEAVG